MVDADAAGVYGYAVAVVEGADEVGDEVAVVGLLGSDFGETGLQSDIGVPHNPLTLLLEHL